MAVRDVLTYPHPALKAVAATCVSEPAELIADLLVTMRAHEFCTGLAATQIGALERVVVVDVTRHRKTTVCHGELVLVNPVVTASEGSEIGREGCLSLPDITANVRRATRITVESLGRETFDTEGFEARAVLHEIDHLDGILILDRVASPAEVFPRKHR